MKTLTIYLLLLIVNTINAQDALKVNYKFSFLVDDDKLYGDYKDKPDVIPYLKRSNKMQLSWEYTLSIKGQNSLYEKVMRMGLSDNPSESKLGNSYVYRDASTVLERIDIAGQTYIMESPTTNFKWILKNETKEILGYTCFKAACTTTENFPRDLVAWYCPLLPFSSGPQSFGGLPGLILGIEYNEIRKLEATVIKYEEHVFVAPPSEGIKISFDKMQIKVKEHYGAFEKAMKDTN